MQWGPKRGSDQLYEGGRLGWERFHLYRVIFGLYLERHSWGGQIIQSKEAASAKAQNPQT